MALPEIRVISQNPCLSHGCSECCKDTEMTLSKEDLARISEVTKLPWDVFAVEAEDGYVQLRNSPEGNCVFLEDSKCSIFQARPAGCRLYPAYQGEKLVELDSAHCPHTDGFSLPVATKDAVRRLVVLLESEAIDRLSTRS